MSDNGEPNSWKEKNTGKEESRSNDRPTENKSIEDKSLSRNKCPQTSSVTSLCKPRDSTASVASTSLPFWKDRKFWIPIAIVGVQLYVFKLTILSVFYGFIVLKCFYGNFSGIWYLKSSHLFLDIFAEYFKLVCISQNINLDGKIV